jgi:hypothetical protein
MEDETTREDGKRKKKKERTVSWYNVHGGQVINLFPDKKPRFNRKKIFTFILFFIVAALLLASIYGFYCFFTSATNFLYIFPNFFLKESVHNLVYGNILSSAFVLTMTSIVGFIGVISLACFISRCFSICYGEFDWCRITNAPVEGYYCLPRCVMQQSSNKSDITIFDEIRALLSGLKVLDEYLYTRSPDRKSDGLEASAASARRADDSEPSSSSDTHGEDLYE